MTQAPKPSKLHLDTGLAKGLAQLFHELEQILDLQRQVNAYLAGGMAMHLYTGSRFTTDVDAEFDARLLLPADLSVMTKLDDGSDQMLYLDTNYNPTFALMHEDHQMDAQAIDIGTRMLRLYILSPVDLAVSKLSRFAANDQEDIATLVGAGLTDGESISSRAREAMSGYVGNTSTLLGHLETALRLVKAGE
jgi:hypothetical protein